MSAERRAAGVDTPVGGPPDGESDCDRDPARRSTLDARRSLYVVSLGTLPYAQAWELQREAAKARIAGEIPQDVLFLVEHPPVVTLGRSSKEAHLVASRELLARQGVELYDVERGGDVTFHGPGQLVGYPIVDLKRHRQDLHWYLRQIEETLIRAIARWGLEGFRVPKYTGVWVGDPSETAEGLDVAGGGRPAASGRRRKLASIGVHARDWVTWHGFALNVATDLRYFDLIVPCGIQSVTMTSIAREVGREDGGPSIDDVGREVGRAMAEVFGLEPVQMPLEWLRSAGVGIGG